MGRHRPYSAIAGLLTTAAFALAASAAPTARFADKSPNAVAVDVELVIAVDVSYSMDPEEQALQREGYVEALRSKEFLQALREGANGKIAITYFEWAGAVRPETHHAMAADRRPGIGRRRRRRNRRRALPARLAHLDFRRDSFSPSRCSTIAAIAVCAG